MSKKIKITWFKIYYNYYRDSNRFNQCIVNQCIETYLISNIEIANINKLMGEFKKWCKEWRGKGYIEIVGINAGAFLEAQNWAKKHNAKFAGKKIKFNN